MRPFPLMASLISLSLLVSCTEFKPNSLTLTVRDTPLQRDTQDELLAICSQHLLPAYLTRKFYAAGPIKPSYTESGTLTFKLTNGLFSMYLPFKTEGVKQGDEGWILIEPDATGKTARATFFVVTPTTCTQSPESRVVNFRLT